MLHPRNVTSSNENEPVCDFSLLKGNMKTNCCRQKTRTNKPLSRCHSICRLKLTTYRQRGRVTGRDEQTKLRSQRRVFCEGAPVPSNGVGRGTEAFQNKLTCETLTRLEPAAASTLPLAKKRDCRSFRKLDKQ